jgi:hypothetical protein
MYQVEYLDLEKEFLLTKISADILIDIVDKHNLKVKIFYEFGSTPEKRSAAFGQLKFRSGPLFTNSVMWYTVCEKKNIKAATYPLIKKDIHIFQARYKKELEEIFAPFV